MEQAAKRLGLSPGRARPSREQLRDAVREYRLLFHPEQFAGIRARRQTALDAMRHLAAFEPRLFGDLVDGNVELGLVSLLLQAESVEQVILHLQDQRIPWHSGERSLTHAAGRQRSHPTLRFEAGGVEVELVIPLTPLRNDPPRDRFDGRPLTTLDSAGLAALLAAD